MTEHKADPEELRGLLQDQGLRVVLDSPEGDYRLEYYTTAIKDTSSGAPRHVRTYRLVDVLRGGVTQEPWDRFYLERQAALIANLIGFGGYRISRVITGWRVKCPACGHVVRGRIRDAVPANCPGKGPPKCRRGITDEDIAEEVRVS